MMMNMSFNSVIKDYLFAFLGLNKVSNATIVVAINRPQYTKQWCFCPTPFRWPNQIFQTSPISLPRNKTVTIIEVLLNNAMKKEARTFLTKVASHRSLTVVLSGLGVPELFALPFPFFKSLVLVRLRLLVLTGSDGLSGLLPSCKCY